MASEKRNTRRKPPAPPPDGTVRERLLSAAVEVFTRKGYAATSVHEIVAAAGVTKPVLYYYFKNKEGIFLELTRKGMQRFLNLIAASREEKAGSARQRITRLCEELFNLFLEHLHLMRIINGIYYGPPQGAPAINLEDFHQCFHEAIRDLVQEGIRKKEFHPGDVSAMTLAITGAMSISAEIRLCHPHRGSAPDIVARVLDVVFTGITPHHKLKEARS